jgi:hypothetical protein
MRERERVGTGPDLRRRAAEGRRRPTASAWLILPAIVVALGLAVVAPVASARADGTCSTEGLTTTCTYTGTDTFTVPSGISEVTVTAIGAPGSYGGTGTCMTLGAADGGSGGTRGQGAAVTGTVAGLAAGDTLGVTPAGAGNARLGGQGGQGASAGRAARVACAAGLGGFGGRGGDASFVSKDGAAVVIAAGGGGGGGGGACTCSPGGAGGSAGEDGEGVTGAFGGRAGFTDSGTGRDGLDAVLLPTEGGVVVSDFQAASGGGGGGGGGLKGGGPGQGGSFDGGGGGGGGSSLVPSGGSLTTTSSAPRVTITYSTPDNDPPVTTIETSPSSPNGSNGWYTSSVTVTVSASDTGGSGVQETRCALDPSSVPRFFSELPSTPCPYLGDGAAVSEEGFHIFYAGAVDNAANEALIVGTNFKIDKTVPRITAEATTAPNANGWYNGDVVVHFTCSDGRSGIPAGACPSDQLLSSDGLAVASTAETVTDAAGNTSAPSNVVTVSIDKTPPTLLGVSPITVSATSPSGAVVIYVVSATDNVSTGSLATQCTPASGGVFAIGTTTVTCTTTDHAGNSATPQSFTVTVLGAAEQLDVLGTDVTGVGAGSSLAKKVGQIEKAVADGRTKGACNALNEFLTMVADQANENKLTSAQAASFTAQASRLVAVLSC